MRMVAGVIRDIALQTTRCHFASEGQGRQATLVLKVSDALIE